MGILCAVTVLPQLCKTAGMLVADLKLIARGVTTNEEVRGKWIDVRNPYDLGCKPNLKNFFCRANVPSILEAKVSPGIIPNK